MSSEAQRNKAPGASPAPLGPNDIPDLAACSVTEGTFAGIVTAFAADRAGLERKYRYPTAARRERMRRFYSGWLQALDRLDFPSLAPDARIDCLLLKNSVRSALDAQSTERDRIEETGPLLPFLQALFDLEEKRQNLEPVDPERTADKLDEIAAVLEQARITAAQAMASEAGILSLVRSRAVIKRAAGYLRMAREALQHWHRFYHGYDPLFTWWVREPFERLDRLIAEYEEFLLQSLPAAGETGAECVIGDPLGRDALLRELDREMIPYTPEELLEIGAIEMDRCQAQLRAIEERDRSGALEAIKSHHVPPGEQARAVWELAEEAIAFVETRDLVTVPPLARETWRTEMMTPEEQKVNPFFLGGEVIKVSFPTDTMPHAQKRMSMRGNNLHFARATVQHELIPGHHLQGFMAERYRAYRQVFSTPFYIEGWALHWEMLLYELDFPRSDQDRTGMLFWRMFRCARIVFSLNFHLGRMTAKECIDYLVDVVGHERANAVAEVRRSFEEDYPPLYQCAYLVGGLQLHALYKELVEGGAMTAKAFHDAVLKENSIPIELLRAVMTGQTLAADYQSAWRFYDDTETRETPCAVNVTT